MNVLFPEPDGPMRQRTSPRLTVRSIPLSTSSRPKCLRTCLASTIGLRRTRVSHAVPPTAQEREGVTVYAVRG